MHILKESRNIPREGFFWIINDKLIGIDAEVPTYNYEYQLSGKTHENTWKLFKDEHLVNNSAVSFDYFPRGRVMVDPNYDSQGNFKSFSVLIMMDPCLLKEEKYKQMVLDYYNLELPTCQTPMWPKLNDKAGINHYTCHQCR